MRNKTGRIVLADRDGTLIVDRGYAGDPREVKLFPGVVRALQKLKKAGFSVVVVTNQSGVGRGFITRAQADRVKKRFLQLLRLKGTSVDGYQACFHAPEHRCACRKPKLKLVKKAAKILKLPWKRAVSVGDKNIDVEMGHRTGGRGVLVRTGFGKTWKPQRGKPRPDFIAAHFAKAAEWILQQERKKS